MKNPRKNQQGFQGINQDRDLSKDFDTPRMNMMVVMRSLKKLMKEDKAEHYLILALAVPVKHDKDSLHLADHQLVDHPLSQVSHQDEPAEDSQEIDSSQDMRLKRRMSLMTLHHLTLAAYQL